MPISAFTTPVDDGSPVLPRRRIKSDDALDITPMIDVTFLLLIFFLVASVPDVQAALNLPSAEFGVGVSRQESFVITIAAVPNGSPAVYLADGRYGVTLAGTQSAKQAEIRAAVQAAGRRGIRDVIIKGEREISYGEIEWIVQAAGLEGFRINLAVNELR